MLVPIALSCLPYPFGQWWPKGNPFLRKVCLSEIRKKMKLGTGNLQGWFGAFSYFKLVMQHVGKSREVQSFQRLWVFLQDIQLKVFYKVLS